MNKKSILDRIEDGMAKTAQKGDRDGRELGTMPAPATRRQDTDKHSQLLPDFWLLVLGISFLASSFIRPMSDANQNKNPSMQRALKAIQPESMQRVEALKALKAIQPEDYELWKYYEDRADRLGERMWSVGIWLITLINATLSLPFVGGLIKTHADFPYLKIEMRVGVALLAIFGVLFCVYSYTALRDVREHTESNWRKAGYILAGTWQSDWRGRKSHGWNVLLIVGVLALIAFISQFLLAIFQK